MVCLKVQFQETREENALQQFIEKYRDEIQGVVSGFDPPGIPGLAATAELWLSRPGAGSVCDPGDGGILLAKPDCV